MTDANYTNAMSEIVNQTIECPPGSSEATTSIPVVTLDVNKGKHIRLQVKVMVPVRDHPNYNFVGKLLGPKGNSLKWLQEQTQTKMAILGRGSMRNKEKESELRELNDPKYSHLNEDLHVEITAYAQAADAYLRISKALFEIKRFLVPDYYDDIRQQQLRELGVIGRDKPEVLPCPSELPYPAIGSFGLISADSDTVPNESITVLRDLATSSLSCIAQRISAVSEHPLESYSALDFKKKNIYQHGSKHRMDDHCNSHTLLPPFKRKPYCQP